MTKPVLESPGRYTKKPVTIEAMQWDGSAEGATPIITWIHDNGGSAVYHCSDDEACERDGHTLRIRTLEGDMDAAAGSWIIRGVEGEFYPCKHEIFLKTHAPDDGSGILVIPPALMDNLRTAGYDIKSILPRYTTVTPDCQPNLSTRTEQLVVRVEQAVDITAERKHG